MEREEAVMLLPETGMPSYCGRAGATPATGWNPITRTKNRETRDKEILIFKVKTAVPLREHSLVLVICNLVLYIFQVKAE